MNARQFFDAVVNMREAGKEYYAYKAPTSDPHKMELLKAALAAEKIVDDEILRVQRIMKEQS